jgi:hypothetical protein
LRHLVSTVVFLGVLGLVVAAGLASAHPNAVAVVKPPKPTASIAFATDVVVKGKNFKKREKLTISLSSTTTGDSWKKKVTATVKGTFSVSFGTISLNSCAQYTIKIVGSLKSRYTDSHDLVPC